MESVIQDWVSRLSLMQQSVLLSAIRGCDGLPKFHKAKPILKFYRRCILKSAFDKRELTDAFEPGGGSFTGPITEITFEAYHAATKWAMNEYDWRCSILSKAADDFLDSRDELPLHYVLHAMHAFEIVGYKHFQIEIRCYWAEVYERIAKAFHLWPETENQMDKRLGDIFENWAERNDRSSSCSD